MALKSRKHRAPPKPYALATVLTMGPSAASFGSIPPFANQNFGTSAPTGVSARNSQRPRVSPGSVAIFIPQALRKSYRYGVLGSDSRQLAPSP